MKLVISTCTEKEAEGLTTELLQERLVACVNIVNGVTSKYWWEGNLETEKETMLFMKTEDSLVNKLIERIKKIHSYNVPEIVAFDIKGGNPDYLNWLRAVLGSK
ncbi:MAG: divalent-cation tolerance protein CutA [bacterium]